MIADIVVALPPDLAADPPDYLRARSKPVVVVEGGERRQDSVRRAFDRVERHADVVVIHDAARPLVTDAVIRRTVDAAFETGAAIAALRASDTVKRADAAGRIAETLPRDEIYLAQTPQAFRVDVLRDALAMSADATDEASLAERAGHVGAAGRGRSAEPQDHDAGRSGARGTSARRVNGVAVACESATATTCIVWSRAGR